MRVKEERLKIEIDKGFGERIMKKRNSSKKKVEGRGREE